MILFSSLLVKRGSFMLKHIKQTWLSFAAGLPGRRFQQQFRLRQRFAAVPLEKHFSSQPASCWRQPGSFFSFFPDPASSLFSSVQCSSRSSPLWLLGPSIDRDPFTEIYKGELSSKAPGRTALRSVLSSSRFLRCGRK
jgi:hypothetical protein